MIEALALLDTAGRISRADDGFCWLTAAAVAIPSADSERLRSEMAARPKWRCAQIADIEAALQLVEEERLWVQTLRVQKRQPSWNRFWDDANRYHQELASRCRSRVSIVKSDTQIRIFLLGSALAKLVGRMLKHDPPRVLNASGFCPLRISICSDDDIQAGEGKRLFAEIWRGVADGERIKATHGIEIDIQSVSFRKEEKEELLLLPDHLAGLVQSSVRRGSSSDSTFAVRPSMYAFTSPS